MTLIVIILIIVVFVFLVKIPNSNDPPPNNKDQLVTVSPPTPLSFVALDFETASSVRESICQVGMAVVQNNQIVRTQSWLVHPHSKYFSKEMTSIHNITYRDVKNSPTFDKVWPEIEHHIQKCGVIAAHYAIFDISRLIATLKYYNINYQKFNVLDSCIAARLAWSTLPNHKLPTLCKFLNLSLDHHDAASDALACANILIAAHQKFSKCIIPLSSDIVCNEQVYKEIFFACKKTARNA